MKQGEIPLHILVLNCVPKKKRSFSYIQDRGGRISWALFDCIGERNTSIQTRIVPTSPPKRGSLSFSWDSNFIFDVKRKDEGFIVQWFNFNY